MNRIRRLGDKFQVLLTPDYDYSPSYEKMIALWDSPYLNTFEIKSYETLGDAQVEAFKHTDLDWERLVWSHKRFYHNMNILISNIIAGHRWHVEYHPMYTNPEQLKNIVFNRVMNSGERFTLVDHLNDIITYRIVNPWTKNIDEISTIMMNTPELRLFKIYKAPGVIYLIGKTDLNTTYEIQIWTTHMYQWSQWTSTHKSASHDAKKAAYTNALSLQKQIDAGEVLR